MNVTLVTSVKTVERVKIQMAGLTVIASRAGPANLAQKT